MLHPALALVVGAALATGAACAVAQAAAAPPGAAASQPAQQRVEITGGRAADAEQRRQSTAAKIVIGRDEIERFGDSNTLELLKRLPGITVPGAPGRGGPPRMRGMAGGYTQILIDGERIAPGFSLDSIPPEQIERIEILRAPTAETGARAIAGTLNIILREGFRRRLNDIALGLQHEHGAWSPGLSWTRNDSWGDWIANSSLSLFRRVTESSTDSRRDDIDTATGTPLLARDSTFRGHDVRRGLHASSRLQWRDAARGIGLNLQPLLIASQGESRNRGTLAQSVGSEPLEFARSDTASASRFRLLRLNATANHRVGNTLRLEWRAGLANGRWRTDSLRREFAADGTPGRTIDDDTDNRDRTASLALKGSALLGDGHNAVAGLEFERNRRVEARTTLWDGVPQLTEFGENLQASSQRRALYAQDEWTLGPQWSLHAGLRAETIDTDGEGANGTRTRNASRVATPLLHAVWKPDPKARDQWRASLTRSYRSPNLNQLIGRASINRVDPTPGANTELSPDNAGNPALKPEVALGVDLAFERFLPDGGVLSVNLFQRRIRDLIRSVVALEDAPSWSPGQPRYVTRPQNIGDAVARGVELEAKFRLDQWWDGAPPTELRANASLYRSKVDAIPGPDNRLAEQPGGTLNLGADHRFRGTPLTLGANLNHTPGYRTRLEVDRSVVQSEKNVFDAYALWAFSAEAKLRLSVSNLSAQDQITTTRVDGGGVAQVNRADARTFVNTQVRLELKL